MIEQHDYKAVPPIQQHALFGKASRARPKTGAAMQTRIPGAL